MTFFEELRESAGIPKEMQSAPFLIITERNPHLPGSENQVFPSDVAVFLKGLAEEKGYYKAPDHSGIEYRNHSILIDLSKIDARIAIEATAEAADMPFVNRDKDLGNGIKSKGGFTIQYIPGLDPNGETLIEGDAPRTYPIADGEAVTYMQGRFLTQMRALGLSTGKSFVEETSGAKNRPAQR